MNNKVKNEYSKRNLIKEAISWLPFFVFNLYKGEMKEAFERLTWDRRRMEDFQLKKLKAIISYAYNNSPFYNDLYKKAMVTPDDLESLEDIQKFPIVSKAELRKAVIENKVFTLKNKPRGTYKTSTSGSLGDPQVLYYDLYSRKQRFINNRRTLWLMGAFPEKRFVLIWRKKSLSLVQKLRSILGIYKKISVVDVMNAQKTSLNKEEMHHIIDEIISFKPQIIRGYTSSLWVIAQLVKKYNLPLKPEHVITSAEYLPPVWRTEMENIFGCPIHNFYGGTEASPIAGSLSGNKELTVFQDFYLSEIVNKEGSWVDQEEAGRVIITDYDNKYMPMIRYDIGDIAEWSPDRKEEALPRFKEVHGRINDIFILPGGKILFSHNWHVYIREAKSITRFKVVQKKIDSIDILVELVTGETEWNPELESLKNTVALAIGDGVNINWQVVKDLELDKGDKFRCVRSELDFETIIKNL